MSISAFDRELSEWNTMRGLVPPLEPTGAFLNLDRRIDELCDAAPMFPGEEDGEEAVVPVGRNRGKR